MPLTFRITSAQHPEAPIEFTAYAGVLDFNAPKDTAYLPYNVHHFTCTNVSDDEETWSG